MENGGHAARAGVAVAVGAAVSVGVGKPGVFVRTATVVAGTVGATVFSGDELQAISETVNKARQNSLSERLKTLSIVSFRGRRPRNLGLGESIFRPR